MAEFVLDASAILAIAFNEPGSELAMERMPRACVSAVNYSEVCAKMVDKGFDVREACDWLEAMRLDVIDFARPEAKLAAALRETKSLRRISFADRACISLASREGATAVSTDRAWAELDLPCPVELIR